MQGTIPGGGVADPGRSMIGGTDREVGGIKESPTTEKISDIPIIKYDLEAEVEEN